MPVAGKLRRLGEMDYEEIRFRTEQKLRLARERWTLSSNGAPAGPELWWHTWDPARVEDHGLRQAIESDRGEECARLLPGYFAGRRAPLFFSRPFFCPRHDEEPLLALYREKFPGRAEEIRVEAERLRAHRFRIFAYPEVEAGREIPWRRDLIHGIESDGAHWSRISCLAFSSVGDSKTVWEPNRHQHFLTLGQAWLLTGNENFAAEALNQLDDWRRANPYPRGINWASSLEAAFRAWSWLWSIHLLSGSQALSGDRLGRITAGLAAHARYIAANLSTYFSPNTHLLGEGFALYAIGLLLPELRGAGGWREVGRRILLEQMERQVHSDGAHLEQSSCYHRYAADFFLCAALLADAAGEPFPASYLQRLERMAEFSLHAAWPSGTQPMTGDADGGQLLLLSPRQPNDHRGLLSTAAIFFARGDFARGAGRLHEETVWLLGAEAAERFTALAQTEPARASRVFPDCGAVIQRSDWSPRARYLRFDTGPQGMPPCAHGHADALAVLCAARGVEWIVDPGTYVYTSSRPWRDFFRSTRAHGTVVVDGCDQAEAVDFFKWRAVPSTVRERAASLETLDFVVASHTGYTRLEGVGVHRRAVVFVRPDYWLVADVMEGSGSHRLETRFPFAPGARLQLGTGRAIAEKDGEFFLVGAGEPAWTLRSACGSEFPIEGWFSEDYGARVPAPVLIAERKADLPSRSFWILWPSPPEKVEMRQTARSAGQGICAIVATPEFSDYLCFRGAEDAPAATEGLWSDAELAFLRQNASGQATRLALVSGCCVNFSGQPLVRAESWLDEFELWRENGVLHIRMAPVRGISLSVAAPDAVRVNGKETRFVRRGDCIVLPGDS
jgi:hypothetical protein